MTVVMNTTIERERVVYEVRLEPSTDCCARCGTTPSLLVWTRTVLFGADPAHRAGGDAFKWAAREQEEIAHKLAYYDMSIESIPFEGVLTK